MDSRSYDVAIIGGGIVGLATALRLTESYPRRRMVVVEKETRLASHQTGHNSGVIHSGIYYRPGSQKAQDCVRGVAALLRFCQENGVRYEQCGKVIVATDPQELPRLESLYERGQANGVTGLEIIGPERLKELEPHARGIKALHVPGTGIVDFTQVALAYADKVRRSGGEILTGARVVGIRTGAEALAVETTAGTIHARHLINCAGLYADRIAAMMGTRPQVRIVPFRGEYYTLRPDARPLVRGLIYPVPDPRFPFLGVHFTRTIHGEVEAGPNAVLALAREGYRKRDVNISEALWAVAYRGFWAMAWRHWKVGLSETNRSLRKGVFVRDLQRLVPAIAAEHLAPGGSGVRAQALSPGGVLLDDFSIQVTGAAIHVLNAPSPGATASLAIGERIAGLAASAFGLAG